MVGIFAVIIGGVAGALMGLVGGYQGGKSENLLMRATDVLMAFPSLIMGLMVLAVLGGGPVTRSPLLPRTAPAAAQPR